MASVKEVAPFSPSVFTDAELCDVKQKWDRTRRLVCNMNALSFIAEPQIKRTI